MMRDSNQSPQLHKLACSKFKYDTFQNANNKGTDAQAGLRLCFSNTLKTGFSRRGTL